LCGYQSSSLVGTVFEHMKLHLRIWFLALFLMTQSKNAVSALELKRQLGVNYKTAWLMKHKLVQVMMLRDEPRKLGGAELNAMMLILVASGPAVSMVDVGR
jgi:hypothetical protein